MKTKTEMELQLLYVGKSILSSLSKFITSAYGKCTTLMAFFASIGLSSIAPLIHILIGFVIADMLFGLAVTIKIKGWSHILSCRLRDSLIKLFFYLVVVVGLFLIEINLVDGYAVTSKLAFALIAGTELWSILSNMLILMPNIPILKLLKNLLSQEISKKIGIDQTKLDDELNKSEEIEIPITPEKPIIKRKKETK